MNKAEARRRVAHSGAETDEGLQQCIDVLLQGVCDAADLRWARMAKKTLEERHPETIVRKPPRG